MGLLRVNPMNFVNLTPHDINVVGLGTIPASGKVARVTTNIIDVGARGGIRLRAQVRTGIENLPAPAADTTYVVSGMVLDALGNSRKRDVVAPDTGGDAVRNEKGHIVAVLGFVC